MSGARVWPTESELTDWIGDIYVESRLRTVSTRSYDCGCSARARDHERKWRVLFSRCCSIGPTDVQ